MLFVALVWGGAGMRIAVHESRRGHDLRHLLVIGVAMGPFLAAYARSTLRRLESTARPVVLRATSNPLDRPELLIALLGPAHLLADVRPLLARLTGGSSSVEVVCPVTFDEARSGGDDPGRRRAVRALEDAGLFLHDLDPGLALLPGPDFDALRRYAADRDAEFVAIVDGDPHTGRGRVEILAVGASRQLDHR